jgi:hypothetical protein
LFRTGFVALGMIVPIHRVALRFGIMLIDRSSAFGQSPRCSNALRAAENTFTRINLVPPIAVIALCEVITECATAGGQER